MNGEISDGVLSFFVNYNMFVTKEIDADPAMENLKQNRSVKG